MKKLIENMMLLVCLLLAFSCTTHSDNKTIAGEDSILKVEDHKHNSLQLEKQDKDSLNFYLQKSAKLQNEHKADLALEELNFALYYANTGEDIEYVKKQIMEVASLKEL